MVSTIRNVTCEKLLEIVETVQIVFGSSNKPLAYFCFQYCTLSGNMRISIYLNSLFYESGAQFTKNHYSDGKVFPKTLQKLPT